MVRGGSSPLGRTGKAPHHGASLRCRATAREGCGSGDRGRGVGARRLEQAWDDSIDPFTNTVKVTIARLRSKLGPPDVIHTTPGLARRG
jgi:hypothetical protein